MKLSVIMIDGGFRENTFGAKYFTEQDFLETEFEVIWVDYFNKINPDVDKLSGVKSISLNKRGTYHSSYCFNEGIRAASGELLVITDADQIVRPNFLSTIWEVHQQCQQMAVYCYRYDELKKGTLSSLGWDELDNKCVLKNTSNYGGCLTVRKKWLLEVNGYEQHQVFATGFHANGLDMYTRLKNLGLAISWNRDLKLYHPWHPNTLLPDAAYDGQFRLIEWRKQHLRSMCFEGVDPTLNTTPPAHLEEALIGDIERRDKIKRRNSKLWKIEALRKIGVQVARKILR